MKVVISVDEWYPVYVYHVFESDNEVDVPDNILKEYGEALDRFRAAEQKLSEYANK